MKKFRLTILFAFLAIISSSAQTNYQKLKNAIESTPIIVEGTIIRQSCFEDKNSGNIFTKNYLLPKVVFKGAANRDTIIFLTRGGRVGDIISTVSHSVQVSQNQEGIFLLHPSRIISNHYEIFSYIERLTYDREYEAYQHNQTFFQVFYLLGNFLLQCPFHEVFWIYVSLMRQQDRLLPYYLSST